MADRRGRKVAARTFAGLLAVAALLHAADPSAQAGPRAEGRWADRMFERLDADGDGRVTRAEADAMRGAMLRRADRDGDGLITEAEMRAAAAERASERAAKRFVVLDGNGDGRVDADEIASRAEARFLRADADGDGVVTRAEFDAALAARRGAARP